MGYSIFVSPRAQKEIENAIDYYGLYSIQAPVKFINVLTEAFRILEINPDFRVRYKNVRGYRIRNFPYTLYFVINEYDATVKILSCFHNKRNPKNRP